MWIPLLAVGAPACAQQFVDQTATRFPVQAEYTNQCTLVDIDGDGDKDIVWANGQGYSTIGVLLKPRVFVNNGAGVFTDETDARMGTVTGCFRGVEAGDVDRDGDWDLILAQDYNRQPLLMINLGAGSFRDESASRLPALTMGSARAQFADVDNDGDLDILLCNSGASRFATTGRPRLFINNGAGVYADASLTQFPSAALAEQMDCVFGDVDNDLDLDFHVGTRASAASSSQLWLNNGAGTFAKLATFVTDATAYSYDFGDIEGDGDLDLIGVNAGKPQTIAMAWSGNSLWRGVIPVQAACATVTYFVRALDVSGNVAVSPVKSFVVGGSCGIAGDFDNSGAVDGADLATLLNAWGTGGPTDLNSDGNTNAADMAILLNNFG